MASINATTSSGIVATADNTGQLALQAAGTTVMTITSTGVTTQVGAPAFSAYQSSAQTISSTTFTKINFQTEEFDTASCYDTSNSRFTPNVAGYYQFTANFAVATTATTGLITFYKNGSEFKRATYNTATSALNGLNGTALIYCNGTTDYVEAWCYIGTGQNLSASSSGTYFQGFLARSA
jgi:hypothetical protein